MAAVAESALISKYAEISDLSRNETILQKCHKIGFAESLGAERTDFYCILHCTDALAY